jgi:hypothetical protein
MNARIGCSKPALAVINRFIDIKQDRAGGVEAAGSRRLRQRHRIALDIAGLLEGCKHRFREAHDVALRAGEGWARKGL